MASKDPMLLDLGQYLRQAREKRGWSQEELAFECGLHRTYIGAVERGEYNVTLLSLRRISDSLGITILDAVKGMTVAGKRRK
jgi:transcriptional regulator with XRE-family HTH domain